MFFMIVQGVLVAETRSPCFLSGQLEPQAAGPFGRALPAHADSLAPPAAHVSFRAISYDVVRVAACF